MEKIEVIINTLSDLKEVIKTSIAPLLEDHEVFAFYGDMGAGKTTIINELLVHLGMEITGSSPTFGIINEYNNKSLIVFHMDCYRIIDVEEALDLGIEDYWDEGDFFFIEWAEKIEPLIPPHIKIEIQTFEDFPEKRKLIINKINF